MADPSLDELKDAYDFSNVAKPEIGKFADLYRQHARIVKLDDDVAARFPDSQSVNEALRTFLASSNSQVTR